MPNEKQEKFEIHRIWMRDGFFHLLAFITFYWSMIAVLVTMFQLIDTWLPNLNNYYADPVSGIRWGVASLVVAFPVYAGLMYYMRKRKTKHIHGPVYFTIFVSALTIIIDLATLVFRYLGGEFTTRFLLKVLVIFMVAGIVLGYQFWLLKRKAGTLRMKEQVFVWLGYAVILAVIVTAFITVGSPAQQRALEFDRTRAQHLDQFEWVIDNYYRTNNALPESLNDLRSSPLDPETGEDYGYTILSETTYEVCAIFAESTEGTVGARGNEFGPKAAVHSAGEDCIEFVVDTSLNPRIF